MQGEVGARSGDVQVLATKAWTAYIRPVLSYGLLALFGLTVAASAKGFGLITAAVAIGRLIYRVFYLRSVRLYRDETGIWLFRGILPWNKGTVGVKWRDLDEALFFTGFWSWAFKSYTMRIGHRFTKGAEIVVDHMKAGNLVAQGINREHQARVAANALA